MNLTVDRSELDLHQIDISDPFLGQYQRLARDVVIPYQWDALNDRLVEAAPSHAIQNFRIAAGLDKGEFYGLVFQDSDVAKWLEAVAWSLSQHSNPSLEQTAREVITLIEAAQQEDGYLNTYFTIKAPDERWTNLAECHELYCAGHMIEAGVAWYLTMEHQKLLDVVCRLADHIDRVFGPGDNQRQGYPGHPEIELALLRLYEVTGNNRYRRLARYFLDQRGHAPHYFDNEYKQRGETFFWDTHGPAWMVKDKYYSQSHQPLNQQNIAAGHAVRFVYLLSGAAHLARLDQDEEMRRYCQRLWDNMVQKRMYITGGIGSQSHGESFSSDYDLPNDTAYAESCASIGLMMFANRMLQLEGDSQYADVMERALYNTVLGGMALDGRHFFYTNPLETFPHALAQNHIYDHVKPVRQKWFGCACCPPNIARILTSLGHYIFTRRDETLFINLYVGNTLILPTANGELTLTLSGNYPWDEKVSLNIKGKETVHTRLALRLPSWCNDAKLELNGTTCPGELIRGYWHIERAWQPGDQLELHFPMPVRRIYGHARLRHVAGKVALQRGPLVYCLEQADNGYNLHNLRLDQESEFTLLKGEGELEGKTLIETSGHRSEAAVNDSLYRYDAPPRMVKQALTFVPWFCWANRGEGEMRVWIDEQVSAHPVEVKHK